MLRGNLRHGVCCPSRGFLSTPVDPRALRSDRRHAPGCSRGAHVLLSDSHAAQIRRVRQQRHARRQHGLQAPADRRLGPRPTRRHD